MFKKQGNPCIDIDSFFVKVRDVALFQSYYPECKVGVQIKSDDFFILTVRISKDKSSKLLEIFESRKDVNIMSVECSRPAFPTSFRY